MQTGPRQTQSEEIVLQAGHAEHVWAVAASADGRFVASASLDRTIKIWRLSDARLWRTIAGPFGIEALAFSPDGRLLASGADNEVTLTNVATGVEVRRIDACDKVIKMQSILSDVSSGEPSAVAALSFSPDGTLLASGCNGDESAKIWEVATGREMRRLNTNPGEPRPDFFGLVAREAAGFGAVAFDPSGRWLATASDDRTVRVWDSSTGRVSLALRGHTRSVRSLAFTADTRFMTSSDGEIALLWNISSGTAVRTRAGSWAAFNSEGQWIVAGPDGNLVAHAIEGTGVQRPVGIAPVQLPAVLSPDKRWLLSSDGPTLVAQNLVARTAVRFADFLVANRRLVASPDGMWLALEPYFNNDTTKRMKLWNVKTNEIRTLSGPGGAKAVFSRDNRLLAAAADDNLIRLWDPATAKELRTFQFGATVGYLSLNATEGLLAASGYGTGTRVWNVNNGVVVPHDDGGMSAGLFSPDDRWLAYFNRNGLSIVDAKTGQAQTTIQGMQPVTFSLDARMLAASAGSGTVKIWDVSNGQEVRTLSGSFDVPLMTFSPDRRWIALRDREQRIFLWDLNEGREVRRFSGHNLGFTAGSTYLWITGADGITHFCTPEAGTRVASLAIIEGSDDWAVVAPDGRFDGTTDGIKKLIAWRRGDLLLPDQFMERRAPGMLANLLAR